MASTTARAPTRPRLEPSAAPPRDPDPASVPESLDWAAFSALFFPTRHRHDLEALTAYGVYRRAPDAPPDSTALAISVGTRALTQHRAAVLR